MITLGTLNEITIRNLHYHPVVNNKEKFVSGCLAFFALPLPPLWANMVFVAALLTGLLILLWLEKKEPL